MESTDPGEDSTQFLRSRRAALRQTVRRAVETTLRRAPLKNCGLAIADCGLEGAREAKRIRSPQSPVRNLEVDVTFVTDAEIAELNRDYRRKNRPTDVLSFAQFEGAEWSGADVLADSLTLGDIVISLETAQRQAEQLGHDLTTEIAFLIVHGTLHLLGYDHTTASQRRMMWKWQEEITASL